MTDIVDSLEIWLQSRLEDVHTMLPGVVQSYDPKTRTATVKPGVKLRSLHADILDIPPISSVPVVWPGSNTFSTMSKDLPVGSGVTLLFSEASIGNWQRGTQDASAEDESRHCLQDAIAIPGLWSMPRVPGHVLSTADWGMCNAELEIGGTNGNLAVIRNQVTDLRKELEKAWAAIDALGTYIKTWIPVSAAPGAPTVPVPAQVAAIAAAQATWTADKAALKGLLV